MRYASRQARYAADRGACKEGGIQGSGRLAAGGPGGADRGGRGARAARRCSLGCGLIAPSLASCFSLLGLSPRVPPPPRRRECHWPTQPTSRLRPPPPPRAPRRSSLADACASRVGHHPFRRSQPPTAVARRARGGAARGAPRPPSTTFPPSPILNRWSPQYRRDARFLNAIHRPRARRRVVKPSSGHRPASCPLAAPAPPGERRKTSVERRAPQPPRRPPASRGRWCLVRHHLWCLVQDTTCAAVLYQDATLCSTLAVVLYRTPRCAVVSYKTPHCAVLL